jgi:RNA methyltransferase, TrmH family
MLIERITSRQNPLVKRFRRVRAGSERHQLFLEGVRLIGEALDSGVHFESVAFTSALESDDPGRALLYRLQGVSCRGARVTPQVMDAIADTDSPQGVAAIIARPSAELSDFQTSQHPLIVISDQLQDPGNLGTIIRTAEAAGAIGVITTRHTVDPFSQKALRASMGSSLRLLICSDVKAGDAIAFCREREIKLIATQASRPGEPTVLSDVNHSRHVRLYTDVDMTGAVALVVGREATGVSAEIASVADTLVHIPMTARVESLNVSAATSVLLYEAARQRRFEFGGGAQPVDRSSPPPTRRRSTKR